MSLGTKNRHKETAHLCRQHLREKRPDQPALVAQFIEEIEGTGKNHDITRWSRFADASWKNDEMLKRLDLAFDEWFNG